MVRIGLPNVLDLLEPYTERSVRGQFDVFEGVYLLGLLRGSWIGKGAKAGLHIDNLFMLPNQGLGNSAGPTRIKGSFDHLPCCRWRRRRENKGV